MLKSILLSLSNQFSVPHERSAAEGVLHITPYLNSHCVVCHVFVHRLSEKLPVRV